MTDHFTETSTQGYFSRLTSSLAGIIIGPLLVLGAIFLLAWNEGRSAKTEAALNEGQKSVVSVSSSLVNSANEGKLVYLSGKAETSETVSDDMFGVSASALRLRRSVQMFQWKEKKSTSSSKNLGGSKTTTTTYDYEKVWSDHKIDSSDFKHQDGHQNPSSFPYEQEKFIAEDAHIGAFGLSESLIDKLDGEKPLSVNVKPKRGLVSYNGGFYSGNSPQSPQIGDVTIKFFVLEPGTVSVVAGQVGDTLSPFSASNGNEIALIKSGVQSSDALFQMARDENSMITWLVRGGGFLLSMIGFMLFMSPLSVLADVIPFLGSLVGAGTGLVSIALAFVVSTITIAISWFAYRPMAAIVLVAAGAGIMALVTRRGKAKLNQRAGVQGQVPQYVSR